MRLEGKVALVTGSGRGIGRETALTLAREGADVIVNDLSIETAEKVAGEVRALGRRALPVVADVSNSGDVNRMVEQAVSEFKRIDILVNNAGIIRVARSESLGEADWDKIMDVNLKGQFLCAQAVGRHMIRQRQGKIINIVSMAGHRGNPKGLAYAVSKGGVLQLTRTLGVEWARYNINVNSVTPGMTLTELVKDSGVDVEAMAKKIPIGRANKPENIANAILFLASSESDNIVGQDIVVDGGLLAAHPSYQP